MPHLFKYACEFSFPRLVFPLFGLYNKNYVKSTGRLPGKDLLMLRAILALLFAILYLIIGIPVLGIEWIISKFNRKAADISQLRMVQWAFRVILFICGTKVTVIGEENVPKDEAVLYIGNHKSYFDIIITYARCPGLTGYVAKNDMAKVPLLSLWMKRLYCLFINRDDVKEALKTILAGIDHIKNGISMSFFRRNAQQDRRPMLPFKEEVSRWQKRPAVRSSLWQSPVPPIF